MELLLPQLEVDLFRVRLALGCSVAPPAFCRLGPLGPLAGPRLSFR